jgi:hypothetical protein
VVKRPATTEREVAALTLAQLNQQIAWANYRATKMPNSPSSLRKRDMLRLIWLESLREKLHGIPAPDRGRF